MLFPRDACLRAGALFDVDLIDVAPAPALPGLGRLHDRVAGRLEMPRRVPALRGIAAADVAAGQAHAQLHPGIARLETALAAFRRRLHLPDLVLVSACFAHGACLQGSLQAIYFPAIASGRTHWSNCSALT